MKSIIIFLLFISLNKCCNAQNNFNILYEVSRWDTASGRPIYKSRLIINNFTSYFYSFKGMYDIGKQPYGKKFMWHSTYKNSLTNLLLYQSQPFNNPQYLVVDTIPTIEWELFDEQKTLLQYKCKKASCNFNGTMYIAWYAEDIRFPFGPDKFGGLPGVILELVSGKTRLVTTAIEISTEPVEMVKPDNGKKITAKKFQSVLKSLHSYPAMLRYPIIDSRIR